MFGNNQGSGAFSGTESNPSNPFSAVTTSSGFGSGSAAVGNSTGIFSGAAPTTSSSSVFGGSNTFGVGTSSSFGAGSVFGTSTTTQNTVFGGSTFRSPGFSTASTTNQFSVTTTTTGTQGGNIFGGTTSQPGITFGGSATQPGSTFGGTAFQQPPGSSFGGTASQPSSTFGTTSQPGSSFGTTSQPGSIFGTTSQAGSTFGTTSQPSSTFGTVSQPGSTFGTTSQPGSSFEGTASQSGSTFGGTVSQPGSIFGTASQPGSNFGGIASKPSGTFGTASQPGSTFGGTASQPGSTFGAVSQPGNTFGGTDGSFTEPGFQGSSTFGTTQSLGSDVEKPLVASVFGGSKSQGSATFGGTSTQSTPIFGGSTSQSTVGGISKDTGKLGQGIFGAQHNIGSNSAHSKTSTLTGGSSAGPDSVFGGPGAQARSVFGGDQQGTGHVFRGASEKTGVKEEGEKGMLSYNKDERYDDNSSPKRTIKRPGRTGLFDKAVSGVKQDQSDRPRISRTVQNEGVMGDSGTATMRTPVRRRSSVIAEDLESKVAIVCKNVPSKLNNHNVLKSHFSQFGEVTRIYPNSRKQQATVHFADHESAKTAKAKGRYLSSKLEPLQIFWSAYTKPGASPGADRGQKESQRIEGNSRSEVNEEIQGMLGTSDIQQNRSKRIVRPEEKTTRPRSRSPVPLQRAPSPKPRSVSPTVPSSHVTLNSLSGAVGQTAGEKYEILKKRDELLREALGLHMKKQTELAQAKTLKASCPDMCPEKERYMRQYQRRLHVYEVIPGTDQVDHAKAVKEYSRSSADQDLPLPNELRSPEVLDKTMDYLLNNIADLGDDGKWGDWYDFLWNRTRSIRKEITQLQLCDLTAVQLVEKCARFHVYCSERLCEEDSMTFDEKINNENLTKSLQTLKELYEDLGSKHGVKCPNEAEFRAYIVLMNLNKGDVLREMQTLQEEVRESREMKFVVSVHSALNSNNYIRFFKLVHKADFLSACVMHRYFTQVRTNALFTMSKAYKNNPLTLGELMRLLSFESSGEAEQFCVHHGLEVRDESVLVDKHRIVEPETPFMLGRAINVIESKQHTCVGEVINGNVLPPNVIIQPYLSFDADNRFMASSLPQDLPVPDTKSGTIIRQPPTANQAETEGSHQPVMAPGAPPTKMVFTNETVKEIAKELFVDVIKEFSKNMSTTFVKAINVYLDKAGDLCDNVLEDTVAAEAKVIAEESLEELLSQQKEVEARRKAEIARQRYLAAEGVCDQIVQEYVDQVVCEIAEDENREVQDKLKEESKLRSSGVVGDDLLAEILEEETEAVAMETHEVEVVERLRELEENCRVVEWMMVARFFNKWKNAYSARVRLQRSMLTFPPTPSMSSVEQQVCELLPESEGVSHNSLHLGKKARLTLVTPGQVLDEQARISQHLMLQRYWKRLRHERAWAPLDVAQIVGHQLYRHKCELDKRQHGQLYNRGCSLYWKLLVCLPEKLQDGVTTNLCNWLTSKLKSGAVPKSKHPHVSELLALYHSEIQPGCKLYVCIRSIKKVLGMKDRALLISQGYLQGAAALVFVLRQIPRDDSQHEEYFMLESNRLRLLLEEVYKVGTRLPLLILVPFAYDTGKLVTALELKRLEQEGLLSGSPSIAWLDRWLEEQASSKKLMRALTQLAGRQPTVVVPAQQTLREFIEDVLHREFYIVIYQDLAKRTKAGLVHQEASDLVSLYNSLVEHMAEIVSDLELTDVSWPVPEFVDSCPDLPSVDWNSRQQLSGLADIVLNLSLPDVESREGGQGDEETDWQTAVDDVWAFVDAVAESGETTRALLYSNITLLLHQCRKRFEEQCWERLGAEGCVPLYNNIPWTDVIVACVHHRLSNLDTYVQAGELGFDEASSLPVYYFSEKLNKFGPPIEWLESVREDNKQDEQSLNTTLAKSVKRKHSDQTHSHRSPKYRQMEKELDHSEIGADKSLSIIDLHPDSENVQMSRTLGDSVSKAIAEEKRKSKQFDDYLEKVLKAGDSIDLGCTETLDISFTPLELQVPLFRRLSAPATTFFSPGLSSKSVSRAEDLVVTPKSFFSPGLNRSSDPPRPKSAGASRKYSADNLSILEKFDILNSSLSSQKQANKLFEMKLQSFIDMDKF